MMLFIRHCLLLFLLCWCAHGGVFNVQSQTQTITPLGSCVATVTPNTAVYVTLPTASCLNNNGSYISCANKISLNVTSPPNMVGTIGYNPLQFSPPLKLDGYLQSQLLVPPANNEYLCSGIPNKDDYGVSYKGKVILVKIGGSCTTSQKLKNLEIMKPALTMFIDSSPQFVLKSSKITGMSNYFSSLPSSGNFSIPTVMLPYDDGLKLYTFIVSSNTQSTQTNISFAGAGHMNPTNRAALEQFVTDLGPNNVKWTPRPQVNLRSIYTVFDQTQDPCWDKIQTTW
jgi:hypothetical protein